MAVVDLLPVFVTERLPKIHYFFHHSGLPLRSKNSTSFAIFSLFQARMAKIMARALVMIFMFISIQRIGSVLGRPLSPEVPNSAAFDSPQGGADTSGFWFLPMLLRDLRNDGVLGGYNNSLVVAGDEERSAIYEMINGEIEVVSSSDVENQNSLSEKAYDIAFVNGESVEDFVDRSLKCGGVVALSIKDDQSLKSLLRLDGYKIVYLRKFSFNSIVIAMKKTSDELLVTEDSSPIHRRLLGFDTEARRAALKKLEDVLLEPPRASSGKSRTYHKRTKYLPDLLGDSLESYPRRVFIDVGLPEKEGGSGGSWFDISYPTRNLDFHKYKIETVTEESSGKEVVQVGLSDWLRRNVKEEYVVMKAEAEAVEEMVKTKAIRLIDELFMECRPRGLSNVNQNRRAYWECLALYGKLKDEGVAVHQWWG